MKKIITIVVLLTMSLWLLCACSGYTKTSTTEKEQTKERFVEIYHNNNVCSHVFVDRETRVQYFINYKGGICPLIDENGKPLLYEGDLK